MTVASGDSCDYVDPKASFDIWMFVAGTILSLNGACFILLTYFARGQMNVKKKPTTQIIAMIALSDLIWALTTLVDMFIVLFGCLSVVFCYALHTLQDFMMLSNAGWTSVLAVFLFLKVKYQVEFSSVWMLRCHLLCWLYPLVVRGSQVVEVLLSSEEMVTMSPSGMCNVPFKNNIATFSGWILLALSITAFCYVYIIVKWVHLRHNAEETAPTRRNSGPLKLGLYVLVFWLVWIPPHLQLFFYESLSRVIGFLFAATYFAGGFWDCIVYGILASPSFRKRYPVFPKGTVMFLLSPVLLIVLFVTHLVEPEARRSVETFYRDNSIGEEGEILLQYKGPEDELEDEDHQALAR